MENEQTIMATFKKCFSLKTNLYFIACYEEKAVFLSTLEGRIYKQLPRQHFRAVNPEDVEFPGDYAEALQRYKTQAIEIQRRREEEKAEKRRLEELRIYEQRKEEVMFVRAIRNAAKESSEVSLFHRFLSDNSWNGEEWTTDNSPTYNEQFFLSRDEAYNTDDLKKFVDDVPVDVFIHRWTVNSGEVLKITDYAEMITLFFDEGEMTCEDFVYLRPEYESLEGCILVFWWWHTYMGYDQKFVELRYAHSGETEELLHQNADYTGHRGMRVSVVMRPEEIEGLTHEELQEELKSRLFNDSWKWRHECERFIHYSIEETSTP